jgi:hypothetical protein
MTDQVPREVNDAARLCDLAIDNLQSRHQKVLALAVSKFIVVIAVHEN